MCVVIEEEINPVWDDDKERIIKHANEGEFIIEAVEVEARLPDTQTWFKYTINGRIVAYGWYVEGDDNCEICIVVDRENNSNCGTKMLNYIIENIHSIPGKKISAIIKSDNKYNKRIINVLYKRKGFLAYIKTEDQLIPLSIEKALEQCQNFDIYMELKR